MNNEETLDKYLADLSFDKDPLTGEIALLTTQHNRFHPGRPGGLLLAILASVTRMEHVFEWTAAYGSTTLWLVKALPEKAHHTKMGHAVHRKTPANRPRLLASKRLAQQVFLYFTGNAPGGLRDKVKLFG